MKRKTPRPFNKIKAVRVWPSHISLSRNKENGLYQLPVWVNPIICDGKREKETSLDSLVFFNEKDLVYFHYQIGKLLGI